MSAIRSSLAVLILLTGVSGCSTVTDFTATSSVVSLTEQQSVLHKASDAYCEDARRKGLATGEASLGSLTAVLTGKGDSANAYWRWIEGDTTSTMSAMNRIRTDSGETASGLVRLNEMARDMMRSAQPSRTDVTRFELALIHARQARSSLADAVAKVNLQASRAYEANDELAPLDRALATARVVADDLAAARMADEVASRQLLSAS